jgi:glycosyltransferase involved in cell wall biosynthesis
VDEYDINVVQTQLLRGLDFLVLTLRFSRKLLIFWTIHNVRFVLREEHLPRSRWLLVPKRWAHRLLYRLCAPWVSGVITVSEDVRKAVLEYLGHADGKVSLIINSVDVSRYGHPVDRTMLRQGLGIPAGAQVMAMVATLKTQKGHRFLLDAMPAVVSQFPDLHLLFIGDGELRQKLEEQTRALNLEDHVHFLGLRDDVPDLLGASDFFILSSLWEGLPMALIEAMASGLPVIATEVSGTREVMVDGQTGLLVPPGDVENLRNAMIHLLSNPERARAMGVAARKRVATLFGAEKQSRQHIQLYFQQWNQTLTLSRQK